MTDYHRTIYSSLDNTAVIQEEDLERTRGTSPDPDLIMLNETMIYIKTAWGRGHELSVSKLNFHQICIISPLLPPSRHSLCSRPYQTGASRFVMRCVRPGSWMY
ncbi:unnamed protein product [Nezara viridula]|uniref:Uncharacterized protein n=1 Tax=Nezara viridula TaxID=85310 RepID=A0A9P0MVY8_NEZVI|nr:unnamed protein product [Nezara viridula]